jgi:hypothetical protein
MQAGAMSFIADGNKITRGCAAVFSDICSAIPAAAPAIAAIFSFQFRRTRSPAQIKGWAVKAHEFINSGPPALLNNPCCCRRVVCHSFLKHAMEVHYG